MKQTLTLREHLAGAAVYIAFATALPRLAYWARWPTRLGPRGLLAYIAWVTCFQFGLRTYLLPWAERIAEKREQLTERLGRAPTDDELADHLGYRSD